MQNIKIGEKEFDLNLPNPGEELKIKHISKLNPILKKFNTEGVNEIELTIELIENIAVDSKGIRDTLENLTAQEFADISKTVLGFLDNSKKKISHKS